LGSVLCFGYLYRIPGILVYDVNAPFKTSSCLVCVELLCGVGGVVEVREAGEDRKLRCLFKTAFPLGA